MKKIKFTKEEDKEHGTLAKEYKRLEILMIIFMSIAICFGTFYFNVICFGPECENKSPTPLIIINTPGNTTDVEKTEDDAAVSALTNEEAVVAVKELFNNDVVRWMYDQQGANFCKTDRKQITPKDLGLNYEGTGFEKCTEYNSYEEMTKVIKKYFTEKYYDELLSNRPFLSYSTTVPSGKVYYNYYEKDGNLYAANTGKGGNMNKSTLVNDATTYEITGIEDNQINALVNAKWLDIDNNDYLEKIKLTIKKEENTWKIDSYEVTTN